MANRKFYLFVLVLFSCFINSCVSTRNLVYLKDLNSAEKYTEDIKNKIAPEIQPDDQLSIVVSTLNPESNILFNSGVLPTAGSVSTASDSRVNGGYLVDKNGFINFPILGQIKLAGLTKEQATILMTAEISKTVKNPIVNIRFVNFRVTVIGEVNRPSTYTISNERINLLEVIALAGDLTLYGKRENVMIIREKDGIRSITRVDLASKSVLNSPNFYLQQNDIIYVEPAKIKALQGSSSTFYITLVATGTTILSLFLVFLR